MNTKISERKLNALAEYRINNIDNVYNMAAIGLYNKVLGLIKGISEKGISEIKLGQFIKDNNLDPRKVNKKLISEIASENSIKITVRKNYPDVRAPNRKQRNYDRFKVLNDAQFARENGITRERARQLRNIHAPETNTRKNTRDYWDAKSFEKSKEIDEWILTYIQNKPVDILIFEFRKFHNLNEGVILGGLINRSRFKKIAKENNINISFGNFRHKNTEYGHGRKCIRSKCNCEIGKLANAISCSYYKSTKKCIPSSFVDYLANEYIEFYREDDSKNHRDFYDEVYDEVYDFFEREKRNSDMLTQRRLDTQTQWPIRMLKLAL